MAVDALSDIVGPFERQFTATAVSVSRKVNNQKTTRKPARFLVVNCGVW
jgi:hypothetical protein